MVKKLKVTSVPTPPIPSQNAPIQKLEETAMTAEAVEIKKKLNEVIDRLNS